MDIQEQQRNIFNDLIELKDNIQYLASYVQNDIDDMVKNQIISKVDILNSIDNIRDSYSDVRTKLIDYERGTVLLLSQIIEKHYGKTNLLP